MNIRSKGQRSQGHTTLCITPRNGPARPSRRATTQPRKTVLLKVIEWSASVMHSIECPVSSLVLRTLEALSSPPMFILSFIGLSHLPRLNLISSHSVQRQKPRSCRSRYGFDLLPMCMFVQQSTKCRRLFLVPSSIPSKNFMNILLQLFE